MCKMYRLSSVCYQHLRSSGADVRALMVQGVAVTMVPKGRNVHEEVGDGTTTFTVKFVGAGACTVPGIAGSGAGIGSVGVNNSKKEEKIEPAKNIEDVDGMVLEYTEGSRQPYQTNPDLKTITLQEACVLIGKLRAKLKMHEGFTNAELVRCILDKFVSKVLKPQGYLKAGDVLTAENIEKAFTNFLNDTTNDLARSLRQLLDPLDTDVIASAGRKSFKKTSRIVHRALDSYLDDYDVNQLYDTLEKVPRLKGTEKRVVDSIARLLFENDLLT